MSEHAQHTHKFRLKEVSNRFGEPCVPYHAGLCECGVIQHIEAFAAELEADRDRLRDGIILVRKMLNNPHIYRTEPGLLSDLLLRSLEGKT